MYKNRSQEFRSNQEKKTRSQIKRVRQQNQKDKFDSVLAKLHNEMKEDHKEIVRRLFSNG